MGSIGWVYQSVSGCQWHVLDRKWHVIRTPSLHIWPIFVIDYENSAIFDPDIIN